MDYTKFQKEILKRKRYLTAKRNMDFQSYFEESKQNERLRNNFVFYALSNRILFNKFCRLTERDNEAKQMYQSLLMALLTMDNESKEVKEVSDMLLKRFFPSVKPSLTPNRRVCRSLGKGNQLNTKKNLSEDMKKYLRTMIAQLNFEENYTKEDENYFNKLMAGKTIDELLAKK